MSLRSAPVQLVRRVAHSAKAIVLGQVDPRPGKTKKHKLWSDHLIYLTVMSYVKLAGGTLDA